MMHFRDAFIPNKALSCFYDETSENWRVEEEAGMLCLGRKAAGWVATAALTASVTMGGAAAEAAMITNTVAVNGGSDIEDPGVIPFLVPQFDPALGTLTGASVSFTGQYTPGVGFERGNSINPPPGALVEFNPEVILGYPNSFVRQSLPSESVPSFNFQAVGTPEAVDIITPLSLATLSLVSGANLEFELSAASNATLPPGGFFVGDRGELIGQIAVTYTYTPSAAVPEPASLALLGAGLLGLCAVRSRRTRSVSS